MNIRQSGNALSGAAMLVAGIGFGAWLLAATPAGALNDNEQLLSGSGTSIGGATLWSSPGGTQYPDNFPAPGKGESAAQLRMSAGVLSALRVKLTTQTTPSSGTLSVRVRINGANTALTCTVTAGGNCNSPNGTTVAVAANDKLAVRISNNFPGGNDIAYTYTLQFD
jgi:hypothetical protein